MIEQGRRIKKVRQDQDLKQDDFCAQLGLSRFSLGRIERGEQAIDSQSLFHLRNKFSVSADWILFGPELKSGKELNDLEKELEATKELLAEIRSDRDSKTEIIQLLKKTAGLI